LGFIWLRALSGCVWFGLVGGYMRKPSSGDWIYASTFSILWVVFILYKYYKVESFLFLSLQLMVDESLAIIHGYG